MTTQLTISELDRLAAEIRAEHTACEVAVRASLEHARNAGDLLTQAKALVNHGEWLPWLAANCDFSERTAQAYMRVATRWNELANTQRVADLSFRDAIGLLADPTEKPGDSESLEALEAKIEAGFQDYLAAAMALTAIRDGGLYRENYGSFEEFCRDRFGLSGREVNGMINFAVIRDTLSGSNDARARDADQVVRNNLVRRLDLASTPHEALEVEQEAEAMYNDQVTRWAESLVRTNQAFEDLGIQLPYHGGELRQMMIERALKSWAGDHDTD